MKELLRRGHHLLQGAWEQLTGSLWFLPGIIVLALMGLAIGLIEMSGVIENKVLRNFPRIFGATAEGSRSILSTIAGSMVTVAGVTFSIMVVAVAQVTTLYTPRVLRTFMRDRLSQWTLGSLIGVFVYCLLVLRTIRSEEPDVFIPSIAVVAAMLLALIAVALLVFFIHHIASTLEVGRIVTNVTRETMRAIDNLFPEPLGVNEAERRESVTRATNAHTWSAVEAKKSGYIQHLDTDALSEMACENQCVIRMERAIGEFVAEGTALVSISNGHADERLTKELNELFTINSHRTPYQDAEFGVRQIVDIAVTALSPGINDPTTAVTCINYLTAVLVRMANRRVPDHLRYVDGKLAVIARGPTFEDMLEVAFNEIAQEGQDKPRILRSMLGSLHVVETAASDDRKRLVQTYAARVQGRLHEIERRSDWLHARVPSEA